MSKFIEILTESWKQQDSLVCVGLDPVSERLPETLRKYPKPFLEFNRQIIDATAQWVCAFKPQIAHYSAIGAEDQLCDTIQYIKQNYPHIVVILDAKRGDIGSTATMYALEAFERYQADAVTVNPYLGGDALEPFLNYADKGVFILCRSSNPGSSDIQQLKSNNMSVAHLIATRATKQWNSNGNVGLVVGATWPEEVAAIRKLVGDMPFLVPAIGAQGGDLEAVLASGLTAERTGLLISVSRSIIYAGAESEGGEDFAAAAAVEAEKLCRHINQYRASK